MAENVVKPKISVLMPAYNAEEYIKEAIESILSQTYKNFEFVIIDDGSNDSTVEIIKSYRDKRIRLVSNERNLGLLESLNKGVEICVGKYIARIDADDTSDRNRLKKQFKFLEKHSEIALVGSGTSLINNKGELTRVVWNEKIPTKKIPIRLMFNNCFTHPSVMMRKEVLPKPAFQKGLTPAEDYDLWIKLSRKYNLHNIPEVLTYYRVHDKNITREKANEKEQAVQSIIKNTLMDFGIEPTNAELKIHRTNYETKDPDIDSFLGLREGWLEKLVDVNKKNNKFDQKIFESTIADIWLISCSANAKHGYKIWERFFSSPLSKNISWSENWLKITKFFIKAVLKK